MTKRLRAQLSAGLLTLAIAGPALAQPIEISASPIATFKGVEIGQQVDGLIWRGGLVLTSPAEQFGGISGVTFVSTRDMVMVTDKGNFISARLRSDEDGTPLQLRLGEISAIQNSRGEDLPPNYSRDSEAVETIMRDGIASAVRVGFENLTRVADFELQDNHPTGAAREVAIPDDLGTLRTNESLEAVCIAPEASPVAGSTLLIAEGLITDDGEHSAWLLGNRDKGPLFMSLADGFSPTDCSFLPDGDLLVLERGIGLLSFTMQVRRIPAAEVRPGGHMRGETILAASGGDIDNMEALAVREMPGGAIHVVLMSDDNFNDWERTLLLEFEVPE